MRSSRSLVFACVAGLLALAPNVQAGKGGALDASFGTGGLATATFPHLTHAAALVVQPDGKIVATGYTGTGSTTSFATARFDTNGILDPTFGVGGQVTTQVAQDVGAAVLRQPDGRIVVAGTSYTPGPGSIGRVMLVRYEATGAPDGTFGTAGVVITAPVGTAEVTGVARQADGRLVVVGKDAGAFMIRRYEEDGSVDATFGTGGVTLTPIGPTSAGAVAVALEPGGAIVVAGNARSVAGDSEFAVARYADDGTLDPTFGTGGVVQTAIGIRDAQAAAMTRDATGRIVVAGYTDQSTPVSASAMTLTLVRYDAGGTLDPSFGSGGVALDTLEAGWATGVAEQPDGKLVMVGITGVVLPPSILRTLAHVVRFHADGTLDATFGFHGGTTSGWDDYSAVGAVALAADGRILVAGHRSDAGPLYPYSPINSRFTVARYLAGLCGNATLEPGEQCDDGNLSTGDCCSAACDFDAAGTFCDDGQSDFCTTVDACDGAGACVGGDPVACAPCETCDPMTGCVSTVRSGCKTQVRPAAGLLSVRDPVDGRKRKLQWRWSAGADTTVDELGSPDTTDDLAICLFDGASQLVASASLPAGGVCDGKPCWTPTTHGFRFRSRTGVHGGIVGARLEAGVAGKATIKIDGKGSNLATPATASLGLPLRLQLQGANGRCWEATYSASGVLRQDDEWFKGRSD